MTKERTILLRTTSFSVEAGEAAVGARPATAALDDREEPNGPSSGTARFTRGRNGVHNAPQLGCAWCGARRAPRHGSFVRRCAR